MLGSLLEKERTVPASYPLTLSSLRSACNQTSSREPVVDYDEHLVEQVTRRLKDRGLLRIVWSDSGRRTLKYHQVLAETLELAEDERALVTVLLLRGPQAPGELRSRTERLHVFVDRGEVEACLTSMAERGLVAELPRRGGDRDSRWAHLLGEPPTPDPAAAPAVDRDSVLSQGGPARDARVRASYDAVSEAYADQLVNEVTGLPFERWLLDRVVAHADGGPLVEVGCGPGHVTAYLADAGADATGIDLSPGMIEQARARFPDGTYQVGDLRQLMRPTTATGWSAVLGWYSLIHLAASELPDAVAALSRPLAPGGWLVLAMHAGSLVQHHDAWFDVPIDLDFVYNEPEDIVALVEAAGLVGVEWYLRGPVKDRGETTNRLYVVARQPA